MRRTQARPEQAQVVIDLRDGSDGGARVVARGLLLDGDRRGKALDRVHVRLLHEPEELAGVGGEGLDVATLSFGVDRVESERRFPRPRQSRDDCEAVAWDLDGDVLEVVLAGTPDDQ